MNNLNICWINSDFLYCKHAAMQLYPQNILSYVDSTAIPNALNAFLASFETHDFSLNIKDMFSSLNPVLRVETRQDQVVELFQQVTILKTSGPDSICGRTLRFCLQ